MILRSVLRVNAVRLFSHYTRDTDKYWTVGSEKNTDIDILFTTRLWGSSADSPGGMVQNDLLGYGDCWGDAPDCDERNRERIECVREIRHAFGKRRIVCGIADSALARKLCPDLILPRHVTARSNYRRILRRVKVCIANTGLWGSIGGRFAEYVSAGKAIVCNRFRYAVPGEFGEGRNYLTFKDKDELTAHCEWLLTHKKEAHRMALNNVWYHRNYVRPDVLVLNTLLTVLNGRKSVDFAGEKNRAGDETASF